MVLVAEVMVMLVATVLEALEQLVKEIMEEMAEVDTLAEAEAELVLLEIIIMEELAVLVEMV